MLITLRGRLLASHILPVLFLALLLGAVCVYLLETRYTFDNLVTQLGRDSALLAVLAAERDLDWDDRIQTEAFVDELDPLMSSRLMLLDANGTMIASSRESDQVRIGQVLTAEAVQRATRGEAGWEVEFNTFMNARIVDFAYPAMDQTGRLMGIVRLSQDITAIEQPLIPLRVSVIGVIALATTLTVIVAAGLARSLSKPLITLKNAVMDLPPAIRPNRLQLVGPSEIQAVAESYNYIAERLFQAEQDRKAILTGTVHELGNALGAMKAAIQTLTYDDMDDEALKRTMLSGLYSQVEILRIMLEDLVLLSEAQSGTIRLQPERIDLSEIVESQCQIFKGIALQKRLNLTWSGDCGDQHIWGDPARLGQIIANLLNNACKYTPAQGSIRVCYEIDSNAHQASVTVSDTGIGIAPEHHEKIFEFMYRANPQSSQKGMGVGLALARQLAVLHHGSLTVTSQLAKGAEFTLTIPIRHPGVA